MKKTGTIITSLHRVSGDTTPLSHWSKPYQYPPSYTPFQNQPIEEKSDLKKSYLAFLESNVKTKILNSHKPIKIFKSKILTLFFKSHHKKKNLRT